MVLYRVCRIGFWDNMNYLSAWSLPHLLKSVHTPRYMPFDIVRYRNREFNCNLDAA